MFWKADEIVIYSSFKSGLRICDPNCRAVSLVADPGEWYSRRDLGHMWPLHGYHKTTSAASASTNYHLRKYEGFCLKSQKFS